MSTAPVTTPELPRAPEAPSDPIAYGEEAPEFSAETITKLARPVDPTAVELRQSILYVPWIHYQAVLIDAFGPGGYRMVPLGPPRVQGNVMTWRMALTVRPTGQRKFFFIKDSVGECAMHAGMSPGNAAEGAQSDALTKGCKALGIFKELFDPAWRRWWEAEHKAKHQRDMQKPQEPKPRGGAAEAPKGAAAPPSARSPGSGNGSSTTVTPADSAAPHGAAATADTGEAATSEAYAAVAAEFKRLKMTRGGVTSWLRALFGVDMHTALTKAQADTAVLLLGFLEPGKAHADCEMYSKLLVQFQADGRVKS